MKISKFLDISPQLTYAFPISDNTPTAILRPPPIPIGGQMAGPSIATSRQPPIVSPSAVQPPPAASTLVPPGSVSEAPWAAPTALGPPKPLGPPSRPTANIGPPPPMMAPASMGLGPPSTSNLGPLTPVSADMGPPTPMMPPALVGLGPPASNLGPPLGSLGPLPPSASVPPAEIGPPPPMMAPQTFHSTAAPKSGPLGRPRRAAYPVGTTAPNVPMGMDPTAPSDTGVPKNIGPPPMGGFRR